jgi:predicted TIM-barrel fold metal-dependent hydrolase
VIFDAHVHVYPGRAGFWKTASSAETLIQAMDRAGVSRAAVIAIEPHLPTADLCAAIAPYADRLVPIGSVEPHGDTVVQEIARQVGELGVRGIKLHPRLQGIQFSDLPQLEAIAHQCGAVGVPLIICSFLGGRDLFKGRTLEWCHDLAHLCPETTIVLAHAGGHRPLDALMVLKANPNIYVDLSFSPLYFAESSVRQDLECLVRKADPKRVLFGSDFPEASLDASVEWMQDMARRLALVASHRDAILYENAARLFGAGH